VNVFFSDEQEEPVDDRGLSGFAASVLEAEGFPDDTEVAVLLVDGDQIASYNERFMGRAGPTDVLAFPLVDLQPGVVPERRRDDPPLAIGDVFLCPAEILRRARAEGIDEESFLYLLVAHGILHLLGYDHDTEARASAMERREDELLALIDRRVGP